MKITKISPPYPHWKLKWGWRQQYITLRTKPKKDDIQDLQEAKRSSYSVTF
ncbi:hypothetical protein [Runella zeae]|uniref:hypothetical protein n=1 Tax=Runella zeae TaxID=94255 RepID=UPI0004035C5B|nr:hypothetical protein [Runella zeae]